MEDAARQAKPWVVWLARLGFVARGIVYMIIGGLAVQAAMGTGGSTTDTRGALQKIITQPFGQVLLGIVAAGFLGYALWRFVQAGVDPEGKGTDAKGIVQRGGYVIIGLIYTGLVVFAVQLIIGSGGGQSSSQGSTQDWTAKLLAQPFGQWAVIIVGAIVIGVGLYQLYMAYTAKFREKLRLNEMGSTAEKWATRSGRLGYAARGIVFGIIGWFLIQAALQFNPEKAGGLGKALQTLAHQPYGPWVLGSVAVGLFAYGIFSLVLAWYRRIYME